MKLRVVLGVLLLVCLGLPVSHSFAVQDPQAPLLQPQLIANYLVEIDRLQHGWIRLSMVLLPLLSALFLTRLKLWSVIVSMLCLLPVSFLLLVQCIFAQLAIGGWLMISVILLFLSTVIWQWLSGNGLKNSRWEEEKI